MPGVWNVGEQRAERDDHLTVGTADDGHDRAAEGLPPVARLDAPQHDEIALAVADRREHVLRPCDRAGHPGDELDLRTTSLEVEVQLRVDRRDARRLAVLGQPAGRARGGVGRVVPSLEARDQHRIAQRARLRFPHEPVVARAFHLPVALAAGRDTRPAVARLLHGATLRVAVDAEISRGRRGAPTGRSGSPCRR